MKPIFLYSKRFPFGNFTGITLLIFVITKMLYDPTTKTYSKPDLSDDYERHETIHVWQQGCLFVLGLVVSLLVHIVARLAGLPTPWRVWCIPFLLPFIVYGLLWFVELLLPPYKTVYMDSPFEREARENQFNESFAFIPFSWVMYFLKKR